MLNWQQIIEKNSAFINFNVKETDFLSENDEFLRSKTGIIYVIVNFVNGKVYVGQTINNFHDRYKCDWVRQTDSDHLKKAAIKYGRENFRILILEENWGLDTLNELEVNYIKAFQSNDSKHGYNKTSGGDNNYKFSADTIAKMSYSKEEFIQISESKHGNKYNYDLVTYAHSRAKVKIYCNACQNYFEQTPSSHMVGKGCMSCGLKSMATKNLITFEEFAGRVIQKFGEEYSFYKDTYTRFNDGVVKGKHNKCGAEFINNPRNLLKGSILCPACYKEYCINKGKNLRKHVNGKNISKWRLEKGFKSYVQKTKDIHGDKFTCLEYVPEPTYNGRNMLKVKQKCNDCFKEFWRNRRNLKSNCPFCNNNLNKKVR